MARHRVGDLLGRLSATCATAARLLARPESGMCDEGVVNCEWRQVVMRPRYHGRPHPAQLSLPVFGSSGFSFLAKGVSMSVHSLLTATGLRFLSWRRAADLRPELLHLSAGPAHRPCRTKRFRQEHPGPALSGELQPGRWQAITGAPPLQVAQHVTAEISTRSGGEPGSSLTRRVRRGRALFCSMNRPTISIPMRGPTSRRAGWMIHREPC